MRALILSICLITSAPAMAADPVAIAKAAEFKTQAIASNQTFTLCMGCAAIHQAQLAADLARYLSQCAAEYPAAPDKLAACQAYYHAYFDGQ